MPLYSLNGLWLTAILPAICFCLGSQTPQPAAPFYWRRLRHGCVQRRGNRPTGRLDRLPTINIPSGLFINKNFMAEAAALVLIWLIAERVWWLAVLVAPRCPCRRPWGACWRWGLAWPSNCGGARPGSLAAFWWPIWRCSGMGMGSDP